MIKASIPWNTRQISKAMENGSMVFDNAIQRGEVWNIRQKSTFIDSLLRNYPVPPIFTIRTEEKVKTPKGMVSVYDGIDGKQRSTTIYQFRNNQFKLIGLDMILDENGEEVDINGMTYDDLPDSLREEFDNATLNVTYFSDVTDDEISEMMWRLNNGKPLTNVENARIKAKDLVGIRQLASHDLFNDYLTDAAIKGYHNEDIVIKTYIMFTKPDSPCFDAKNTRQIYADVEFTEDIKNRLNGIFNKAWETIVEIENNAPKSVYKKAIKKTNMLAIISLMERPESAEVLAAKLIDFFNTDDGSLSKSEKYNNASTNGTNHAPQVKARMEAINDFVG